MPKVLGYNINLRKIEMLKFKKMHETSRTHELLAKCLYESHFRAEGRVVFPSSPSDSHVE